MESHHKQSTEDRHVVSLNLCSFLSSKYFFCEQALLPSHWYNSKMNNSQMVNKAETS